MSAPNVLPDMLAPGLRVVFCGTAAGAASARAGAYYAGRGNKFWDMLFDVGLTPRRLAPHQFRAVLRYGIGLTDVVKTASGSDASLPAAAFDPDRLRRRMLEFGPAALAFNGKRAAQAFFGRRRLDYGRQPAALGGTALFVLPSTSGAAQAHWDPRHWRALAEFLRDAA